MKRRQPLWRIEGKDFFFASVMLLIPCPYCGDRPEVEFAYAGEGNIVRPANAMALDDDAWGAFLYHRGNTRGLHNERWRHVHGCGRFFNARRDTMTDLFAGSWKIGEAAP